MISGLRQAPANAGFPGDGQPGQIATGPANTGANAGGSASGPTAGTSGFTLDSVCQ